VDSSQKVFVYIYPKRGRTPGFDLISPIRLLTKGVCWHFTRSGGELERGMGFPVIIELKYSSQKRSMFNSIYQGPGSMGHWNVK